MNRHTSGPVDLRDLTESRALRDLTVLYLSSSTSRVQDLALITDIEEIAAVGPDTVIVLSDRLAMGGWMISAALRYAWERRACALIVPENSITETAIELARRLDVSLLATSGDPTRFALDAALQIGVARAGSVARVQAFTERVAQADTLTAALELLSRELGGTRAGIESSGAIAIDVAAPIEGSPRPADRDSGRHVKVTAPLYPRARETDTLVISVVDHQRDYAQQLVLAAVPSIRALLFETRLTAMRESLPPMTITALTGSPKLGYLDDPAEIATEAMLHWPISGDYAVVCILASDRERLSTAVHQIWQAEFPEVPLALISDGWLAFVPVGSNELLAQKVAEMRVRLVTVRSLGLMVGVSTSCTGAASAADGVREAWLAARLSSGGSSADEDGDSALIEFAGVSSRLLGRLMPRDLAKQLAVSMLPKLLADPAAEEIIAAVVAYLDCRGSASTAAKLLGVHRNTMQTRIRRAEELGVPLSEPQDVLPMHMLLAAIVPPSRS